MQKGFTLIELLITVAILGILSAIAVPQYQGYVSNSRAVAAQNNLRNIYLQQQEYFTDNNIYYSTGAGCADASATINTNLFNGDNVLTNDFYNYCINQTTTTDFTARAQLITDVTTEFTITNTNATNF
ncbi:MAG: prepilin-type N-terminal cleavage/methylation domain-containing protein [Rickettsiales bacterium]|nr:prepilin-type N-terminal cleavage/methylation domain-containing protein [Pseudomonadota bacterium]MDA0966108.1 prepilin-type N-terminal cleavage/methylation domain-containing protein [Pseudomonadota bacterium]MDG4543227.1 prepilin-type N-terminal cleavage/methylation domain-containing protein [Rickettsiales bacterium]MDG4545425.1 prepilin-type N-terminal cleavage/methylation domain-containing protein [Rickettsiales bacterium]MDG4547874.1 prepilin-type N-terminal cleavage/methylation domain-c